jgi:NAD(P)-dependent dehydrogenase (short-subunit alcohol dehydrogenase family)
VVASIQPADETDHTAARGGGEPVPHRVALVTGAADPSGIGAACARALAQDGCAVGLLDRRPGDQVVAELTATGARAASTTVDLADATTIDPAVDQLEHELGGATAILVNCAADFTMGRLGELDASTLTRVLSVNVVAAAMLARRVAPGMARRHFGRIVNIASDTFDRPPGPGMTAYITSKGGLIGLTRSLAVELGPSGITVNAISPGLTDTAGAREGQPDELFERVRDTQAIKRMLQPADYAGILTLLVSEQGGAITGQTIRVDAGVVMV